MIMVIHHFILLVPVVTMEWLKYCADTVWTREPSKLLLPVKKEELTQHIHVSMLTLRNYRDHTPLHCAAVAGHDKLVKSLITDFHAEVDPTDKNNATPLHLAAHAGHLKVVNSLLEHNADVSKKVDLDGMKSFNALDLAIDGGHE